LTISSAKSKLHLKELIISDSGEKNNNGGVILFVTKPMQIKLFSLLFRLSLVPVIIIIAEQANITVTL
jgi:hypothetical protein